MEGHLHILTQAIRDIARIFDEMGFVPVTGPELETEFYNFDALNIPADHPARDMQDTFWLKEKKGDERQLLRTHTSSVQIRHMEKLKDDPQPFRIIVPGKVYRNEATDATHEAQFYQIEGMLVDRTTSLAELKGVLEKFFKEFLGPEAQIRFRPSYFAFVEPGVEVDVLWKGKWLELLGAGMVHPSVLQAGGFDPNAWKGFAFGGGIDRLVLLRYGIDDIRHLYTGDLRLINQF